MVQTAHLIATKQKLTIDFDMFTQHWDIPLHRAQKSVQHTTQCGVRNNANPTLVHRFCTHNCMLCYQCLSNIIFTDTMFASTQSQHGNKSAWIFSFNYRWSHAYPMKTKGVAHEAYSLMFQHEGVPPLREINDFKEQTHGKFCQKRQDAGCEKKTTDLHSPWKNAAEFII